LPLSFYSITVVRLRAVTLRIAQGVVLAPKYTRNRYELYIAVRIAVAAMCRLALISSRFSSGKTYLVFNVNR
jgi:hypothetical protein